MLHVRIIRVYLSQDQLHTVCVQTTSQQSRSSWNYIPHNDNVTRKLEQWT